MVVRSCSMSFDFCSNSSLDVPRALVPNAASPCAQMFMRETHDVTTAFPRHVAFSETLIKALTTRARLRNSDRHHKSMEAAMCLCARKLQKVAAPGPPGLTAAETLGILVDDKRGNSMEQPRLCKLRNGNPCLEPCQCQQCPQGPQNHPIRTRRSLSKLDRNHHQPPPLRQLHQAGPEAIVHAFATHIPFSGRCCSL